MWNNIRKSISKIVQYNTSILNPETVLHQQLRTTFIVKRRFKPPLYRAGYEPQKFRKKHYIYDLIKFTDSEMHPDIDVILTSYVEGLGDVGTRLKVKSGYAYNHLLLPGRAVYATPDNIELYKDDEKNKERIVHSSQYAQLTVATLSRIMLSIVMNKDTPWMLQPWHIRTSFRKCGYEVPEETITMPLKPIKGPDINLQDKLFYVTVTINNLEKVNVQCRIHHWSTDITERQQHVPYFWQIPSEAIFPEDGPILASMPMKPIRQKPMQNP